MPGTTDLTAGSFLEWLVGKTAMPALPANVYMGLFSVAPGEAGGGTELSAGNYARKSTAAADWAAAAGSGPRTIANANAITFVQANADWASLAAPAVAFGLFDAAVGGNLRLWDYLGAYDWFQFTTVDLAGNGLQVPAHGLVVNDPVAVTAEYGALPLPATDAPALAAGNLYYVQAVPDANSIRLSRTLGGAVIDVTGVGGGHLRKVAATTILNGTAPNFAAGALTAKQA